MAQAAGKASMPRDDQAKVVPVSLTPEATPIYFEVTPVEARDGAWVDVAQGDPVKIEQAGASLNTVLATLKPMLETVVSELRSHPMKPKTVELAVGIKLSAEVGFFIAKSNGEASLDIHLSWDL